MDQESNSKPGNRGSWRDRLGINEDNAAAKPEASSEPVKTPAKSAGSGKAKVVANPAPMAPRPGAAVKAPVRPEKAAVPEAEKEQENPKPASERPQAAGSTNDDAFAERLRQHRAAAEEAVKKRSTSPGLDKFSFAKKEVESARAESVQPKQPAARGASPEAARAGKSPESPNSPRPMAAVRPPAQAAASAPPATAPIRRPPPLQPVRPPSAGGGLSPSPRPSQFSPPQSPYGQPPFGQPQQAAPAYRPQGSGYTAPPGPRPQPYPGYSPQGADSYARGGYSAPRPPAPQPAPGQGQRFAPPSSEHDLFEDNGYRPASPLGRGSTIPARNEPLRPDFDDPFDDKRDYGGRTANDYSQTYREYDDEDYEDEEPRRWGGLIMVILALLTIGVIAAGLIYWYMQQSSSSGNTSSSDVPVISAPEKPAKAQPDTTTNPPATAPAQGKKLIYDRILGDSSANEPETIVPRQETPQAPASNTSNSGDDNLLPLPLPPPPQTQGSVTPENAGPDPAQRTASAVTNTLDTQEAAGSEPAASAVLPPPEAVLPEPEPRIAQQGSIEQPPVPRTRPANLVAAVQQAPSTEFRPVLQPAPPPGQQLSGPVDLQQQAAIANPQVQAPVSQQAATPAPAPVVPRTRGASRDDDPLSGLRAPLSSPSQTTPQQVPQQQRSAAVTPPPLPTPQPQQPITSQSLQSFSPPPATQNQAARTTRSGYVVQLAAYRSEQEALGQYQQLRARHRNIIGDLPPAVQQTNLGASGTFYRLGMGPMASKQAATEMCNKLIAAGERDCLVRRR